HDRQGRMGLLHDERREVLAREREQLAGSNRARARRAGEPVDERELAEVLAREELGEGRLALAGLGRDLDGTVEDQEHRLARVATGEDRSACGPLDLVELGRERREVLVGEILEERDVREQRLPIHLTSVRTLTPPPTMGRGSFVAGLPPPRRPADVAETS